MDRVYTGIALQNIRGSVDRIKDWLAAVGKIQIDNRDLENLKLITEAENEDG